MNVAIVGSRTFEDEYVISQAIISLTYQHGDKLTIVSGGARGADSLAEQVAKELSIPTIVHLPNWNLYGKSAGFRRNDLIVKDADMVIAFFADGKKSRGTSNTVAQARLAGKEVMVYHEGEWEMRQAKLPL